MKYEFTSEEVSIILTTHLVKKGMLDLDTMNKDKDIEIEVYKKGSAFAVSLEFGDPI